MPSRFKLLLGLVCASAGAISGPASAQGVFDGFADGAIACALATQTKATDATPIEQRGWHSYPQAPEIAAASTSFARKADRVFVVTMNRPPQCAALWAVTSSSGTDAIFAGADQAVATSLKQKFGARFQAAEVRTDGARKVHPFIVGDAILVLSLETHAGATGGALKVSALNKDNLAEAMAHAASQHARP